MKRIRFQGLAFCLFIAPLAANNSANMSGTAQNAAEAISEVRARGLVQERELSTQRNQALLDAAQNQQGQIFEPTGTPRGATGGALPTSDEPPVGSNTAREPSQNPNQRDDGTDSPGATVDLSQLGGAASDMVDQRIDEYRNQVANATDVARRFENSGSDEDKTDLISLLQLQSVSAETLEKVDGLSEEQQAEVEEIGQSLRNNALGRPGVSEAMESVDQDTLDESFLQALAEESGPSEETEDDIQDSSSEQVPDQDTSQQEAEAEVGDPVLANCSGSFGLQDEGALIAKLSSPACSQALAADPGRAQLAQQVIRDLTLNPGQSLMLGRGGPGERIASLRGALGIHIGSSLPPAQAIRARQQAVAAGSTEEPRAEPQRETVDEGLSGDNSSLRD